jgi:4-hydroxybenzoate polyprenyltransferase
VIFVSLAGLALCGAVLIWRNLWNIPWAIVSVVGLATYTPLKRRWWGGPPWNSWIVAVLPVMGLLCGVSDVRAALMSPPLHSTTISVFASYAVFVILGYHKDISADRATGYETLPVRFGWGVSVGVSLIFCCGALVASAWAMWEVHARILSIGSALWGMGGLSLLLSHALMMRHRDEKRAHISVGWVVRGYVLLHAAEAVAFRPALAFPALAFYLLFEGALAMRPDRAQV